MINNKLSFLLVHIGDSPTTEHIYFSIKQVLKFNGSASVFLLIEAKKWDSVLLEKVCSLKVIIQDIDEIDKSSLTLTYQEQKRRNKIYGSFWDYTSRRFFVLHDFCLQNSISNICHIESDVLVYKDFNCFFNESSALPFVLYPLDQTRGIASVLLVRDYRGLAVLCESCLNAADIANDMEFLGNFSKNVKGNLFGALPTISNSMYELLGLSPTDTDMRNYSSFFSWFQGVFDAAALGQFVDGIDKIHNCADTIGFSNESSIIKLNASAISWDFLDGMKTPVVNDRERTRIFNLHIHSKRLHKYTSDNHCVPRDEADIISGNRIASLCDCLVYTNSTSLTLENSQLEGKLLVNLNDYHIPGTTKIDPKLFKVLDSRKNIFIYGDLLRFFVDLIVPFLEQEHALVIHNSDVIVDDSYSKVFKNPYVVKLLAQNLTMQHPRAIGVPIGLANSEFSHGDIELFFRKARNCEKRNLYFKDFISYSHPSRSTFQSKVRKNRLPYQEFLDLMTSHRYIACPRGNGLDTHRLWEAIYCGSIPVLTPIDFHAAVPSNLVFKIGNWQEDIVELLNNQIFSPPLLCKEIFLPHFKGLLCD